LFILDIKKELKMRKILAAILVGLFAVSGFTAEPTVTSGTVHPDLVTKLVKEGTLTDTLKTETDSATIVTFEGVGVGEYAIDVLPVTDLDTNSTDTVKIALSCDEYIGSRFHKRTIIDTISDFTGVSATLPVLGLGKLVIKAHTYTGAEAGAGQRLTAYRVVQITKD
jgi:hypothetical protein